jgi:hypothetical protein
MALANTAGLPVSTSSYKTSISESTQASTALIPGVPLKDACLSFSAQMPSNTRHSKAFLQRAYTQRPSIALLKAVFLDEPMPPKLSGSPSDCSAAKQKVTGSKEYSEPNAVLLGNNHMQLAERASRSHPSMAVAAEGSTAPPNVAPTDNAGRLLFRKPVILSKKPAFSAPVSTRASTVFEDFNPLAISSAIQEESDASDSSSSILSVQSDSAQSSDKHKKAKKHSKEKKRHKKSKKRHKKDKKK